MALDKKKLTAKNILSILVLRLKGVLITVLISFMLSLLYVDMVHKNEYAADAYFLINKPFNITMLTTAKEMMKGDLIVDETLERLSNLESESLMNVNLSKETLKSGISTSITTSSPTVKISFSSSYEQINSIVVNVLLDVAIEIGNDHYLIFTNNLEIVEYSSSEYKTGMASWGIVLIATSFTLFFAMFFSLVCSVINDCVYTIHEDDFVSKIFEINSASRKNALKLRYGKLTSLHNLIETENVLKTKLRIGFISLDSKKKMQSFLSNYVDVLSNNGYIYHLIDFEGNALPCLDSPVIIDMKPHLTKSDIEFAFDKSLKNKSVIFDFQVDLPSAYLKNQSFSKFESNSLNFCDVLLYRFSHNSDDFSYLLKVNQLDSLVIEIYDSITPSSQIEKLFSNLKKTGMKNVIVILVKPKLGWPFTRRDFYKGS